MRCYGSHACHGLALSIRGQENLSNALLWRPRMVIGLVTENHPPKVHHLSVDPIDFLWRLIIFPGRLAAGKNIHLMEELVCFVPT